MWDIVTSWRGRHQGLTGHIYQVGLPRVTVNFGPEGKVGQGRNRQDPVVSLESLNLDPEEYAEFLERYAELLDDFFSPAMVDRAYDRWMTMFEDEGVRERQQKYLNKRYARQDALKEATGA